jgi:hypothetical protein
MCFLKTFKSLDTMSLQKEAVPEEETSQESMVECCHNNSYLN